MSFDRPVPHSTPKIEAVLDVKTVCRIIEQTADIDEIIQNVLKARKEAQSCDTAEPRSK